MARTATISPNPASRVWRGRCARRSRSIRATPARCHPPRVSSAAELPGRFFKLSAESKMPVYTVHAPFRADSAVRNGTDRLEFVRDGLHVWAFLLGPVWLLWHRLWLALVGYVAVIALSEVALSQLRAGAGARFVVMLLVALLMGFEAASLWRWTLSRGNW